MVGRDRLVARDEADAAPAQRPRFGGRPLPSSSLIQLRDESLAFASKLLDGLHLIHTHHTVAAGANASAFAKIIYAQILASRATGRTAVGLSGDG